MFSCFNRLTLFLSSSSAAANAAADNSELLFVSFVYFCCVAASFTLSAESNFAKISVFYNTLNIALDSFG